MSLSSCCWSWLGSFVNQGQVCLLKIHKYLVIVNIKCPTPFQYLFDCSWLQIGTLHLPTQILFSLWMRLRGQYVDILLNFCYMWNQWGVYRGHSMYHRDWDHRFFYCVSSFPTFALKLPSVTLVSVDWKVLLDCRRNSHSLLSDVWLEFLFYYDGAFKLSLED